MSTTTTDASQGVPVRGHTPGPWRVGWMGGITGPRVSPTVHLEGHGVMRVPISANMGDTNGAVAWVLEHMASPESLLPDARLIAAAPDLLAALQAVFPFIAEDFEDDDGKEYPLIATFTTQSYLKAYRAAKAAIALALPDTTASPSGEE